MTKEATLRPSYISDEPAIVDELEGNAHERAATLLAEIIQGKEDANVRSVGIEGSWGSGKSSLIQLLLRKLNQTSDSSEEVEFVFDVWEHQHDVHRKAFAIEFLDRLRNVKGIKLETLDEWSVKLGQLVGKSEKRTVHTTSLVPTRSQIFALFVLYAIPVGLIYVNPRNLQDSSVPYAYWGAAILALPILLIFITYLRWRPTWQIFSKKFWSSVNDFSWFTRHAKKYRGQSILSLASNKAEVTVAREEKQSMQPELLEFKELLIEMLLEVAATKKRVIIVFDNLDRADKDALPAIWSFIQSTVSVIKSPSSASSNARVIVPYDKAAVSLFSAGVEESKYGTVDHVLQKTLDISLHVPPPLLSDWKAFLEKKCVEARLVARTDAERSEIERIVELHFTFNLNGKVVPREVIRIINAVVTVVRLVKTSVPLPVCFAYASFPPLDMYGRPPVLPDLVRGVLYRYNWQQQFAAIRYGVSEDRALHVLLDAPLRTALLSDNKEGFRELSDYHGFSHVLDTVIVSLGGVNVSLNERELGNVVSAMVWACDNSIIGDAHDNDVAKMLCKYSTWTSYNEDLLSSLKYISAKESVFNDMYATHGLVSSISQISEMDSWDFASARCWARAIHFVSEKLPEGMAFKPFKFKLTLTRLNTAPRLLAGLIAAIGEHGRMSQKLWGGIFSEQLTETVQKAFASVPAEAIFDATRGAVLANEQAYSKLALDACRETVERQSAISKTAAYLAVKAILFLTNVRPSDDTNVKATLSGLVDSGYIPQMLAKADNSLDQRRELLAAMLLRYRGSEPHLGELEVDEETANQGLAEYREFLSGTLDNSVYEAVIDSIGGAILVSDLLEIVSDGGTLKNCAEQLLNASITKGPMSRLNTMLMVRRFQILKSIVDDKVISVFLNRFDGWKDYLVKHVEKSGIDDVEKEFIAASLSKKTSIGKWLGEKLELHLKNLNSEEIADCLVDDEWRSLFFEIYGSEGIRPRITRELEAGIRVVVDRYIDGEIGDDELGDVLSLIRVLPRGTRTSIFKHIRDVSVDSNHESGRVKGMLNLSVPEYFTLGDVHDRAKDFVRVVLVGAFLDKGEQIRVLINAQEEAFRSIGAKLDKDTRAYLRERIGSEGEDEDFLKLLRSLKLI